MLSSRASTFTLICVLMVLRKIQTTSSVTTDTTTDHTQDRMQDPDTYHFQLSRYLPWPNASDRGSPQRLPFWSKEWQNEPTSTQSYAVQKPLPWKKDREASPALWRAPSHWLDCRRYTYIRAYPPPITVLPCIIPRRLYRPAHWQVGSPAYSGTKQAYVQWRLRLSDWVRLYLPVVCVASKLLSH